MSGAEELRELLVAALPPHQSWSDLVVAYGRECAAAALEETARKWQWGAWADAPRIADRVAERIGTAQYVTDWLRGRAAALKGSEERL